MASDSNWVLETMEKSSLKYKIAFGNDFKFVREGYMKGMKI